MKILIAEDEPVLALFLRRMLEANGHDVRLAANGAEAWRILSDERVSVVISDWMMPGLDGPSLCRRIRECDHGSYTYIILMTSRSGRGDRMEGLRAGADDFLVKPVDQDELTARLEIARRILDVQARLERQNERLLALATTDELTGLANRRELRRALDVGFALAKRQDLPLAFVLADVDHFKAFNDSFGHPAGDRALATVAGLLKKQSREHETVARFGGEEFALVLLGATEAEACEAAERMRASLADHSWPLRPVTASFGVAAVSPEMHDPSELVEHADRALYQSKRRGRNCVTAFGAIPASVAVTHELAVAGA